MSKLRRIGNNFPPLQRRIILHLARTKPQDINETKEGIKGHYKSTWLAFNTLKKKGFIKEVGTSKNYRGQNYPLCWLTEAGVFIALHEGADPKILFRKTCDVYPDNNDLKFIIEAVPILGKNALEAIYLQALTNGSIGSDALNRIIGAQMQKRLTPEQIKQFVAVLKKYPKPLKKAKDALQQTQRNLKDVSDLL